MLEVTTALTFKPSTTLRITDDDPTPKLKFGKTDIQLAKGNEQTVTVEMGVGAGGAGSLPIGIMTKLGTLAGPEGNNRGESEDLILLSVSPPGAVGPYDSDRGIISITMGSGEDGDPRVDLEPNGLGEYKVGTIASAVGGGIEFQVTAKAVSGFTDERITLTLRTGELGLGWMPTAAALTMRILPRSLS